MRIGKLISCALRHKPEVLNLTTYEKIKTEGLKPMKRLFVHLSGDYGTAENVGLRYAHSKENLVVIKINTQDFMKENSLWLSENGVYLTKYVSPKYFIRTN